MTIKPNGEQVEQQIKQREDVTTVYLSGEYRELYAGDHAYDTEREERQNAQVVGYRLVSVEIQAFFELEKQWRTLTSEEPANARDFARWLLSIGFEQTQSSSVFDESFGYYRRGDDLLSWKSENVEETN